MSNQPDQYLIDHLRTEIADRKVVAVIGAGVSLGATNGNKVASWVGLLKHGVKRCYSLFGRDLLPDWREQQAAGLGCWGATAYP